MEVKEGIIKNRLLLVLMIPILVLVLPAMTAAEKGPEKPYLVLQVTVDQMRGDFPMRYKEGRTRPDADNRFR